jgi:hypothetical protein
MNKLLTVALSLPLVACVVGTDTAAPGGDDGSSKPPSGNPGGSGDHITTDTTWTGTMDVTKTVTVDRGATLTIAAGATVRFAPNTAIGVDGIVDVQGSKASPVHLSPSTAGGHHSGFVVSTSGELKMTYGVQAGGGIQVNGGKITVSDTAMSQASGDFLVVGGGTVNVTYSAIGLEPGGSDTTHCDMHFGGNSSSIKVTHSNVSTSSYGIMLYGGSGVDLTYNNWFSNSESDVDTSGASGAVSGDISFGWFEKAPGPFPGATITKNSLASARLIDAGPR